MSVTQSGMMMYCFHHKQSSLILSNKVPSNINKACYEGQSKYGCKCEWEDVGTFIIDDKGEMKINKQDCPPSTHVVNLYDGNMNIVSYAT
jgi:hypothetical protein